MAIPRPHVTPKCRPARAAGLRQAAPGEGAVLEVAPWAGQLLYSTQRGGVHVWDLRARRDAWTLPCTPAQARPGAALRPRAGRRARVPCCRECEAPCIQ